ncbi:hypothetical protein BDW62DRAFT_10855 [Aspergillus aurantiobrunneus]
MTHTQCDIMRCLYVIYCWFIISCSFGVHTSRRDHTHLLQFLLLYYHTRYPVIYLNINKL